MSLKSVSKEEAANILVSIALQHVPSSSISTAADRAAAADSTTAADSTVAAAAPMKYFKHARKTSRWGARKHLKRNSCNGRFVALTALERKYQRQRNGECVCRHAHAADVPCMPVLNKVDRTRFSPHWKATEKKRKQKRQETARRRRNAWGKVHGPPA